MDPIPGSKQLSGPVRFRRRRERGLAMEPLEGRYMLAAFDLLVFSKTAGFRHNSIETGIAAIENLAAANDFTVTASEDANIFTQPGLHDFEAIVFLSTTGDILNAAQEAALEEYIQNGGGFVGIHSAADTEYDWPWYGQLLGAYFQSHPAIQQATIVVADQVHPSTAHLPSRWIRTDEWYNYSTNPRGDVHVLATLDESTYNGGADGFDNPITWYHNFDGGRSWYTGLGHTAATYSEPLFLDHLLGGILYAAGQVEVDGGASIESNYEKVVLDDTTVDPMELAIASDGRVFYVERGGDVHFYDPATGETTLAGSLSVFSELEDGLLGIVLDPNFAVNNWIYLYYSPAGSEPKQHVSRFTLMDNEIDMDSEQVLLAISKQRDASGHAAGSMAFGPDGSLFISTGDDTDPFESSGYAPIDERPGRSPWDAQKSSSNTADLRGKVLRIKPEADGTYSIPGGNLFPADSSEGRPEIYAMGMRNPFRISVDQETGWLYFGDVGPDAQNGNELRGPRGYDEINQARTAGNFGWPYVIADNQPYRDFDFATDQSGPAFDPAAPVNDSPNNTGAASLPPAEPALIWYPYNLSSVFPELPVGGGRTAMAGPVYHFDSALRSDNKLPEYFDNTLFIYDWSRNWIREVKLDEDGNILKINPFADNLTVRRPMDMEIGPDGAIYMLEWGTTFNGGNADAQLVRIDYVANIPTVLAGDYNGDGMVGAADYTVWKDTRGSMSELAADGDKSGVVDDADYDLWKRNFGQPLKVATSASQFAAAGQQRGHLATSGIALPPIEATRLNANWPQSAITADQDSTSARPSSTVRRVLPTIARLAPTRETMLLLIRADRAEIRGAIRSGVEITKDAAIGDWQRVSTPDERDFKATWTSDNRLTVHFQVTDQVFALVADEVPH